MAEELVLTDPVTEPAKTTTKYKVVAFTMDLEGIPVFPSTAPGLVGITLKSDLGTPLYHTYHGDQAVAMIKQLNTANLSTKSMQRRILEKLEADGVLDGTVTGTPDPPVSDDPVLE